MTFLTLDLTQKKWLLLFLSVLLCWWLFSASATASASGMPADQTQAVYQITESELTTLENNLAQLKSTNERLQTDLRVQSNEATLLRKELDALRKELSNLKQQSMMQESSLTNANKLLETYATEAKRERLRIKAQRNGWAAAAVLACIGIAIK